MTGSALIRGVAGDFGSLLIFLADLGVSGAGGVDEASRLRVRVLRLGRVEVAVAVVDVRAMVSVVCVVFAVEVVG